MADARDTTAEDRSEPQETPDSERSSNAAAQRALEEAAERRKTANAEKQPAPKEVDGRGGLDPARYGDWEVKGIISDF